MKLKEIKQLIKTIIQEFLNEQSENTHLVEVIPNKYVYHTSNPFYRDKISKEGFVPKGESATWLSDTKINGKVIFAVNSDDKEDWWDSTYDDDIYKIDTSKLKNKWYGDPNFDLNDDCIITFEKMPINSGKLIYQYN